MGSKLIFLVIIAIILIAVWGWYFYSLHYNASLLRLSNQPATSSIQPSSTLSTGDKTTDIANDLNQTPDDSAVNQEMDSLDENLKNF